MHRCIYAVKLWVKIWEEANMPASMKHLGELGEEMDIQLLNVL